VLFGEATGYEITCYLQRAWQPSMTPQRCVCLSVRRAAAPHSALCTWITVRNSSCTQNKLQLQQGMSPHIAEPGCAFITFMRITSLRRDSWSSGRSYSRAMLYILRQVAHV